MKEVLSIDALLVAITNLEQAEMKLSGDVVYLKDESRYIVQNMIALHLYLSKGEYKPVYKVETTETGINLYHVSPDKEKTLVTNNLQPLLDVITVHEFIITDNEDIELKKLNNYMFQSLLQLIREALDCFYQDEHMNNQPIIVFEGGLLS